MANVQHFSRVCLLTVSTFGLIGVAGCSDTDHDADSRPHRVERIETTTINHPANDHDGRYQDRLDRDRDRGPQAERLDRRGLPRDAMMLEEGRGSLSTRARDTGTIYLYDMDDNRVVWSGQIERGDRFAIDPDADSAMVNGRMVYHDDSVRRHRHQIYIDTNPR